MTTKNSVNASIDRPSKLYYPNAVRKCNHPDCKIRLSKYNSTEYCSAHERYSLSVLKSI